MYHSSDGSVTTLKRLAAEDARSMHSLMSSQRVNDTAAEVGWTS